MATTPIVSGVQYSGKWTLQSQAQAVAASTWPTQPVYLLTWGRNANGQLGLGNTTNYSSPKQVGSLSTWKSLSGYTNTYAITVNGALLAWGNNGNGQLGLNNQTYYSSPKQVGSLTNWLAISSGQYHAVAVKTDGTLWSWGKNQNGELGLGTSANQYSSPKQVGALTNWATISCNLNFSVAVKTNGTLWTWGSNSGYQLGQSTAYTANVSSPVQVGALTSWLNISAGRYNVIATKTDGTLWSWGNNGAGQCGLNNTTTYSSPKQVGSLTNWVNVSAGSFFGIAIKTDGTIWSWGANPQGQLGQGNTTSPIISPTQIGLLTNWSKISTGYVNSAAIKTDGTLWLWGNNVSGQLGTGNITKYSSPKQVGALTKWLTVSAGYYTTRAILSQ
jgi:alpha-tubulin suppressor-like RCC1 family protein